MRRAQALSSLQNVCQHPAGKASAEAGQSQVELALRRELNRRGGAGSTFQVRVPSTSTRLRKLPRTRSVTGPGLPVPMTRPSSFTTGMDLGAGAGQEALVGAPDVVARQVASRIGMASSLAMSKTVARVMPLRAPCDAAGVKISPLYTVKRLSAVHSAT